MKMVVVHFYLTPQTEGCVFRMIVQCSKLFKDTLCKRSDRYLSMFILILQIPIFMFLQTSFLGTKGM